jgi:hypothetical protein
MFNIHCNAQEQYSFKAITNILDTDTHVGKEPHCQFVGWAITRGCERTVT